MGENSKDIYFIYRRILNNLCSVFYFSDMGYSILVFCMDYV